MVNGDGSAQRPKGEWAEVVEYRDAASRTRSPSPGGRRHCHEYPIGTVVRFEDEGPLPAK